MKQIINFIHIALVLLSILFLWSCSSEDVKIDPPNSEAGVMVKIMSYNIQSGQRKGLEAIAEVIKNADPDFVGIQEVETYSKKFDFDVPKKLSELTGMKYFYFSKARDLFPKGEYGELILSKHPFTNSHTHVLDLITPVEGAYIRALGIIKTQIENKNLYFAVTHLDHKSDVNRLYQAELIVSYTEDLESPIILTGDLNTQPSGEALKYLKNIYNVGVIDNYYAPTAMTPNPDGAIDYILYSPKNAFLSKSYEVDYDSFYQSDHFPVIATFKFN